MELKKNIKQVTVGVKRVIKHMIPRETMQDTQA